MSKSTKVGIDAIGFHSSPYYLDLKTLAIGRGVDPDKYVVGLGQEKMAVSPPDEDIVTLAAMAAEEALRQVDRNEIEWLLFATESGIDQSKSAGVFVHHLLDLPARCRVVELKQACYAATAGVQMALALLKQRPNKKVLLIASDIARYGLNTTGESSQGGGAIALVLSNAPRILVLEEESSFYTEDVMDFWRPNYREEALVDGKYSCELYLKMLQKTWREYTLLSGRGVADHAQFCYHVPVPRLVEKAHQWLLKINQLPKASIGALTDQTGPSLVYPRTVGNCYTAGLYLSFLSLLENRMDDLSHQRIGFYSYGSGCSGEFFSGVVEPTYRQMLNKADHWAFLERREGLSLEAYEAFYRFAYPTDGSLLEIPRYTTKGFRLAEINQHKRLYVSISHVKT